MVSGFDFICAGSYYLSNFFSECLRLKVLEEALRATEFLLSVGR